MRLSYALQVIGLHFTGMLVYAGVAFIGTVCNQRLLALQRTLVKQNILRQQIGQVTRTYQIAVSVILRIQLIYACFIKRPVLKFRMKSTLCFQNPCKLILIILAFHGADQLATYLLPGHLQQGVVDVSPDSLARII